MDAGKDTQGRTARACADDAARLCSTAAAYLAALAAELIPDELGEHGGGTKCPATAAFAATSRMEHAALSLLRGAEAVRDMSTSAYGNPSETYRERGALEIDQPTEGDRREAVPGNKGTAERGRRIGAGRMRRKDYGGIEGATVALYHANDLLQEATRLA